MFKHSYSTWPDRSRTHNWDQFPQLPLQSFSLLFLAQRTQHSRGWIHLETYAPLTSSTHFCSLEIGGSRSSKHIPAYGSPYWEQVCLVVLHKSVILKKAKCKRQMKRELDKERKRSTIPLLRKTRFPSNELYCICIWRFCVFLQALFRAAVIAEHAFMSHFSHILETWLFNGK